MLSSADWAPQDSISSTWISSYNDIINHGIRYERDITNNGAAFPHPEQPILLCDSKE